VRLENSTAMVHKVIYCAVRNLMELDVDCVQWLGFSFSLVRIFMFFSISVKWSFYSKISNFAW
jgi:hypothetical protein